MTQPHDHNPSHEEEKRQTGPHEETIKRLELVAQEAGPEAVHDYMRELLENDSPEADLERASLREAIADYYAKDFVLEATHEGENLTRGLQSGAMEADAIAASARQTPEMMRLSDTLMRLGAMESRAEALVQARVRQSNLVDGMTSGKEPIPDVAIKKFSLLFEEGAEEARQQFSTEEVDWTRLNQITDSLNVMGEQFALLRHFGRVIEEAPRHPEVIAQEIPRARETLLDLRNHLATTL